MSTKSTRFTVGVDIEDIKLSITLDYVGSRGIIDETYVLHEHANNELFSCDGAECCSSARGSG